GHVVEQGLGGVGAVAQGNAQPGGPGEGADVVGVGHGVHGVGDDVEQQGFEHFEHCAGRREFTLLHLQDDGGRKQEAGGDRDQGGGKRADEIQQQNGSQGGGAALAVAGNGGGHQHKHQHRRHGDEGVDKERAEQADRFGGAGC